MAEINLKVKDAGNIKDRVVGLIGKKDPSGIHFRTRFGIHTCGLNFPIDVLILNREREVVGLKKSLKPYRVYFWNPKFSDVVELPHGSISEMEITLGTKLNLEKTN